MGPGEKECEFLYNQFVFLNNMFGGFTRFRLYNFIAEHANRETLHVLHECTAAHEKNVQLLLQIQTVSTSSDRRGT